MSRIDVPLDKATVPGPCIVCGVRDYPLSFGGNTICPACDCGHTGQNLISAQKRRIEELEALVTKLQEPPPCKHTHRTGWASSSGEGAEWCDDCGADTKHLRPLSGPTVRLK